MEVLPSEDDSVDRASGTTLQVFLPEAVPASQTGEVPLANQLENPGEGATILLVEDEASIRAIATMYLKGDGYRVIEANDGPQAVILWEKHEGEIDLVLTDLMIPGGLNGHQLVERLQADRPDLKAIFVSGYTCDSLGEETFLDETTNFLQKPYRLKNLSAMILNCLGRTKAA